MAFGVYVHWPYCARICPYCDFNVYRPRGTSPGPLLGAIAAEIAAHRARIGPRETASVFLGGGTPSLLEGAEIAALLAAIDAAFPLTADVEITLEANPEDAARLADAAAAGVNRFSIGVQSLVDADLKALGRWHDAAAGRAAVAAAARTGRRVSADFIYARAGQGVAAWEAELAEAAELPVEHLSLYQLTIEAGTAFERAVRRGRITPPGEGLAADFFEATQAIAARAGFTAYEISNHARGAGAQSRHNLLYWRAEEWAGIGPGAHGRLTIDGRRTATKAHRRPADYIGAVAVSGVGWEAIEPLDAEAVGDEALLMGLRLAEGIDPARLTGLRGRPLSVSAINQLAAQGLIDGGKRLRLTPSGRLVADRIAAMLAV
jgi:oxygen-independent coproporphyrinogen-3 oxidase